MKITEQTFFILAALAAGPRHGYGIISDVKDMSDGDFLLSAGTLYAALDRLGAAELIHIAREDTENGRFARFYALTKAGRTALSAELTQREARLARARALFGPSKRKVNA